LVPLLRILELVLKEGARLAAPGEFTKRAFLNGRIDLAQAEAVMEIIRAKSERGLMLAMRHLDGSLSRRIQQAKARVLSVLAETEAALDFPEEGLETISAKEAQEEMEKIGLELKALILGFQEGRIFEEGIATALIGRPNVGKSSLFNALLQRDRAIVTSQPGTTRDSLEEVVNLQGLPFLLIDTAGMRGDDSSLEMAEKEGLERATAWMEKADLLLVLIDGSEPLTSEDRILLRRARGRRAILVVNKKDLPQKAEEPEMKVLLPETPSVKVSARSGAGLEELKGAMFQVMERGGLDMTQDLVITHLHHRRALEKAQMALLRGKDSLANGLPAELVSLDLRECLDALGVITGETTSEDLLEEIFSRFCIGK